MTDFHVYIGQPAARQIEDSVTDEFRPLRFEEIIKCFPRVTVQLAHLRNVSECIYMMETYANVYCDTACAPSENIDKAGKKDCLQQKLLYGTDFPI